MLLCDIHLELRCERTCPNDSLDLANSHSPLQIGGLSMTLCILGKNLWFSRSIRHGGWVLHNQLKCIALEMAALGYECCDSRHSVKELKDL